jgi:hypothetical protein
MVDTPWSRSTGAQDAIVVDGIFALPGSKQLLCQTRD